MAEAYIVDAVRTPVGRRGGGLVARCTPPTSGAHALKALVDRTGIDPAAVEDVVFGCVDTIGPQAGDIARTVLARRRAARARARHHHRPPVRLVASRPCTSPPRA